MKPTGIILLLLALSACLEETHGPDQCLRRAYFESCMKMLPAGPTSTHYNDWDEVVSECDSTARSQSYRAYENVKPECRS